MIHNLATTDPSRIGEYDICIIGTGPAGITVARELAAPGRRICVLESGELKPTPHADALRRVVSDGIQIKTYSRERVLGGASTTWAGLSSPLDPIDFAPRPWLRRSGWPVAREELLHYYSEAAARYRFAPLDFFTDRGFGALRAKSEFQPAWQGIDEKIFLACEEPQNFGREHRAIFEASVDLYLDSTVVRLEGNRTSGTITRAVARASSGRETPFHAGIFIVSTGGIENARLLLVSRDLCPAGIGNDFDQVGRGLMNHPKNYHGILSLAKTVTELPYYFGCIFENFAGYAGLRLPESEQRAQGLLNSYVRFEPLFPWSGSTGVESLVTIAKRSKFMLASFKARRKGKVITLRDYSETGDDSDLQNERKTAAGWLSLGWNVVADSPRVARYAYFRLFERAKPAIARVRLRNFMEMEPDPENRVLLTNEMDSLGVPVPLVRHQCTEIDRKSIIALHQKLQKEFPRTGFGSLDTALEREVKWPLDQDASHHMGTTRMGARPEESVVDANCKVHGVANLYMAGASVFPTSGCANPTFTIVALSIRLADHLKLILQKSADAPRTNP